jgi:hypothetical protein
MCVDLAKASIADDIPTQLLKKRTLRRTGRILLAVLFVLVLAGFVAVRWYLAPFVQHALESSVDKSSGGLYHLSIKKLRINLFTGTVRARGLIIQTNAARWETLLQQDSAKTLRKITLSVQSVGIYKVHWWQYWKTHELALNRIEIVEPQLDMTIEQDSVPEQKTDRSSRNLLDQLPRLIAPHAGTLRINRISVENARFLLRTKSPGKETIQSADSIAWNISNIHLAATDTTGGSRALYADNLLLNLHHYRRWTVGHRYLFSIKAAQLIGKDSLFAMQHCSMRSVGGDSITVFEPRLRRPKIEFTIPETTVYGLDLYRALHRNEWTVRSILLNGAYLSLFNNADLPLPLHRKMPNEWWRSLNLPVHTDTLLVQNADIFYHEKNEDEKGMLTFRNANILVLNLSNNATRMTDKTPVRVFAGAQFMGTGALSVALSIPLLSPDFYCPYQATLLEMPFADINAFVGAKGNVRIDAGFVDKITVKAQATSGITRGVVKIYYHGLKISVLKEESQRKNNLASIVANLMIHNNSDDDKADRPYRTAKIAYQRKAADGFLRLLWRAAQSGLIKTMTDLKVAPPINDGRDQKEQQKKAEKREKKAAQKQKEEMKQE